MAKGYSKIIDIPGISVDANFIAPVQVRVTPNNDGTGQVLVKMNVWETEAYYDAGEPAVPNILITLSGQVADYDKKTKTLVKELADTAIVTEGSELFGATEVL